MKQTLEKIIDCILTVYNAFKTCFKAIINAIKVCKDAVVNAFKKGKK